MTRGPPDLATTPLLLPPDAKLLPVGELAPRLRAKLDVATQAEEVVVTRPGFRVTTRLVPAPLSALLAEFRTASLLTAAVLRFSRAHGQDPQEILGLSYDALVALVDGRILVAASSPDAAVAAPSLAAGQAFGTLEIERLLRSLDDTEVYRARLPGGEVAALKVARDDRAAAMLAQEVTVLARLGGGDTPRLLDHGKEDGRAWLAMEWREGVSVAVAAQQARAARDGARLHRLLTNLLEAYARLHARGVLHGDVHPGNVLVAKDGSVTILDFGQARFVEEAVTTDPRRAGIVHFHDPQMASALLAGAMPPAATLASEQYALAALAYFLLTGLHHVAPAAEHAIMLARILRRPPLSFAARGVEASPRVEAVLRRALAKNAGDRFDDTGDFARAFRAAGAPRRVQARSAPTAEQALASLRSGAPLAGVSPAALAWLALRAALLHSDAELLAVADLWASRADDNIEARAVAAEVGRVRSDRLAETEAMQRFLSAADREPAGSGRCRALLLAARILEGAASRGFDANPLRRWAERCLGELWAAPEADEAVLHAALALGQAGAVPVPAELPARLATLADGSVWLWALAHDAFAEPAHAARAVGARRPQSPVLRALAYLRLHQLTGEMRWVAAARRAAARATQEPCATLLAIEMEAPWRALAPPWQIAGLLPKPR